MKFFRPTAHVVSIIAPLALTTLVAHAAQSPGQPVQVPKTASSSKHPGAANRQKSNSTGNDQKNSEPIHVTIAAPQKSAEELKADAEERERQINVQERIGTFSGWLVVVSAAQVIAIIFGYIWTRRAADAARKSAEVSEKALVATQRAYLAVSFPNVGGAVFQGARTMSVTVDLANNGTTPAMDSIHHIDVRELPDGPTNDVLLGSQTQFAPFLIGPHATITSAIIQKPDTFFGMPGTFAPLVPISQIPPIYCFGWVAYRDVFADQTKPHVTQFCYRLANIQLLSPRIGAPIEKALKNANYRFSWASVGSYNQSDEASEIYESICAFLPKRTAANAKGKSTK